MYQKNIYFYFLKVNISYYARHILYIYIENIAVEETVSQIFDILPGSFSIKFRK